MASTQVTFTPEQISYLRDWFGKQSEQYVKTVMDDDFDADEENFERLCASTFNVSGFREGVIESTTREVKVKKQRKKKDPNEPKRPKSAYMCWLWSDDGVKKVKEDNEGISHKEAVSMASAKWKQMSDDDKASWIDMSNKEKEDYDSKMKTYIAKRDANIDSNDDSNNEDSNTEDNDSQDIDGFTKMDGKMISGYSSAGKDKYNTLQDAINNMKDDSGGIVFDGKKYTIRKIGTVKNSNKNEILWLKQ